MVAAGFRLAPAKGRDLHLCLYPSSEFHWPGGRESGEEISGNGEKRLRHPWSRWGCRGEAPGMPMPQSRQRESGTTCLALDRSVANAVLPADEWARRWRNSWASGLGAALRGNWRECAPASALQTMAWKTKNAGRNLARVGL